VEKLQEIPGKVRELIESHQPIRFDRSHFAKIGPSSFDFEAVYIVLTPDYGKHMNILQDINLRLVEWFNKERIVFSTPQRVYYIESKTGAQTTLERTGENNPPSSRDS